MGCHSFLQGIFPSPGIETGSPMLQADSLVSQPPGPICMTNMLVDIYPLPFQVLSCCSSLFSDIIEYLFHVTQSGTVIEVRAAETTKFIPYSSFDCSRTDHRFMESHMFFLLSFSIWISIWSGIVKAKAIKFKSVNYAFACHSISGLTEFEDHVTCLFAGIMFAPFLSLLQVPIATREFEYTLKKA